MDVEMQDRGPLPGLAEVVAGAGRDAADALDEADLPLHATMGVRDSVGALIDWVNGRKLSRTLPEEVIPVTWFECHVPYGGTAQERFEATRTESAGVVIKAFGSGLGQGRNVALTLSSEASAPRTACVSYVVDLRVLPRVYESGGRESVVTEVLGPAAHRSVDVTECPFCRMAPDAIDEFENLVDVPFDLRGDSVGRKEVVKLDWSSESSIDVGLNLPKAGVAAAVNARVIGTGSFSITYELKPGYLYRAYRPLEAHGRSAPRWAYSS